MNSEQIIEKFSECLIEVGLDLSILQLVESNPSADLPYHNNSHNFIVGLNAYQFGKELLFTVKDLTHVLVAGMLHDYAHTGETGDDAVNVRLAVEYVDTIRDQLVIYGLDVDYIKELIWGTCNPEQGEYTLQQQVLRDADLMGWVDQDVEELCEGLSAEMKTEVTLESTQVFLETRTFFTEPGQRKISRWVKNR